MPVAKTEPNIGIYQQSGLSPGMFYKLSVHLSVALGALKEDREEPREEKEGFMQKRKKK